MTDETPSNVPRDQGLSTLGLIMQLFGTLSGVLALALIVILAALGDLQWWGIIAFALTAVRSKFHADAGAKLPAGFAGIRRYIHVALAHTVAMFAIDVIGFGGSLRLAIAGAVGLLVWPAALAVMIRMPRFSRFDAAVPLAEDKGFEGLAILMSVMGMTSAIQWGALLLVMLLSLSDIIELGDIYTIMFMIAVAALFVRSYIHVTAGLAGVRETNFARSVRLGNRYSIVGFTVALIVTGILVFFAIFELPDFLFFALIACACWMLLAWPMIVRKFVGERQLASLADNDVHHRAPDAGLTGLGWLLIANGMMTLSVLLPDLVGGSDAVGASGVMVHFLAKLTLIDPTSVTWNLGLVAIELWAGIELVRMSSRFRLAATVYALATGAWATIHSWPPTSSFHALRHLAPEDIFVYVPVATNLVVPVATLLLVRRRTAPTAQARYRPDPS
ncbi:MAG TPA: hypothetical protein VGM90_10935 [Kofleriaceae bacterium]|jgi:hypothetical protein